MKKALLALLSLFVFVAVAHAQQEMAGMNLHLVGTVDVNAKGRIGPLAPAVNSTVYSNIANFLGSAFANGGAALQGTNTITRLVADDITPLAGYGGLNVNTVYFSVANLSGGAISARVRVRFYAGDGAGGGPGTLAAAFSFNPIAFPAGVTTFYFSPGGALLLPTGTFWAGMTFDNSSGTTGATAAMLNNLGQGIFDPPTVGSSLDTFFLTTSAGSFAASNPVGGFSNFGGNPPANFGWAFDVELPVPAAPTTWGRVKSLYR